MTSGRWVRFCVHGTLLGMALCSSTPSLAAPSRSRARPAAKPAPAPTPAPAPLSTPPSPSADAFQSVDQLLNAADQACKDLFFERCIELASSALERPALTEDERVRAYVTVAGAYAVVGQAVEAEKPYRLLLRLRPDFDLPPETPPKILAVFRKVQAEENAIRNAVKEAERKNLIQSIKLSVSGPPTHQGGTPLTINANLVDPKRGVQSLILEYRTDPAAPFASIPFQGTDEARTALFTAAQTSSDHPVRMEYIVVARDGAGEILATDGSHEAPRVVDIAAGQVQGPPLWQQRQFRLIAGGSAAALTAGAGALVTTVVAAAVVGSASLWLILRGDGVSAQTTAGKHRV